MRKMRIIAGLFLMMCLLGLGVTGYTYQQERTPEYALQQLATAIADRDYPKFKEYADTKQLITSAYDESTEILANSLPELQQAYPKDWFFKHDKEFMTEYIAERRDRDLQLAGTVLEYCFQTERQPSSEKEAMALWISSEKAKFEQACKFSLDGLQKGDGYAIASISVTGDDSSYGRLVQPMVIELYMQPDKDGRWRVTRLSNVRSVFLPMVQAIEDYWEMQGWQ